MLPGVTVEVASPALIEKVRTTVTDGAGKYQVPSLRPGTYSVTFSLTGFNTVKREGIELTSDFTATVNGDLKVGAMEETITVAASSPLVDVQSITTRTVMTRDVMDSIPTGRNIQAVGIMIPGTSLAQGGGGALDDVGDAVELRGLRDPRDFRAELLVFRVEVRAVARAVRCGAVSSAPGRGGARLLRALPDPLAGLPLAR